MFECSKGPSGEAESASCIYPTGIAFPQGSQRATSPYRRKPRTYDQQGTYDQRSRRTEQRPSDSSRPRVCRSVQFSPWTAPLPSISD